MSKIKKRKSQVSADFDATLNIVVKSAFKLEKEQGFSGQNEIKSYEFHKIDKQLTLTNSIASDDESFLEIESVESKAEIPDERTFKIPSFLKHLFSDKKTWKSPFEETSIANLSFKLAIYDEKEEKFYITVYSYFTVERMIVYISKKKSLNSSEISLYYKNSRLENQITLSRYGINARSHLQMKLLKKEEIIGKYLNKRCSINIYSSDKIDEIRSVFSKKLKINPESIELKYKEMELKNNKQFFIYDIKEGSMIDILLVPDDSSKECLYEPKSPGYDIVQCYLKMTGTLKSCDCEEKRIKSISYIILAIIFKKADTEEHLQTLREFNNKLHHRSCFKSTTRSSTGSSIGDFEDIHTSEISQASVDQISLHDCINAEIDRIERNQQIVIEVTDLEFLVSARNFKEFRHFLKDKIGTRCSLRSVSMLYKYGMSLISFIGSEEDSNPTVDKMHRYIKLYFRKYYEKNIIEKGGLAALTLSESDVDD